MHGSLQASRDQVPHSQIKRHFAIARRYALPACAVGQRANLIFASDLRIRTAASRLGCMYIALDVPSPDVETSGRLQHTQSLLVRPLRNSVSVPTTLLPLAAHSFLPKFRGSSPKHQCLADFKNRELNVCCLKVSRNRLCHRR
jgi:hypothetical protein